MTFKALKGLAPSVSLIGSHLGWGAFPGNLGLLSIP